MVKQSDNYPEIPNSNQQMEDWIYKMYVERKADMDTTKGINIEKGPTLEHHEFMKKFTEVTTCIDDVVKDFHGIKCFDDGDLENHNPTNWYYLHICDVINVIVCNKTQRHPHIIVGSTMLTSIKTTFKITGLELSNKENVNHEFFMDYIDIFYLCYPSMETCPLFQ